jgi:hypothetical protein
MSHSYIREVYVSNLDLDTDSPECATCGTIQAYPAVAGILY